MFNGEKLFTIFIYRASSRRILENFIACLNAHQRIDTLGHISIISLLEKYPSLSGGSTYEETWSVLKPASIKRHFDAHRVLFQRTTGNVYEVRYMPGDVTLILLSEISDRKKPKEKAL